jgi:CheY-like chemotaxis protein
MTKTILVVEDDHEIGKGLKIRLRAAGYEVHRTHDGPLGLLSCEDTRPDLLLIDISLPAGEELGIIERIRRFPHLRQTPFILIMSSRRPELRTRARALGAAAFIEKPYDSRDLIAAVGQAVSDSPQAA